MRKILLLSIIMLLVLVPAGIASAAMDHSFITKYEGTQTCMKCHEKETKDMHASAHYQWKTKVNDVIGWEGTTAGKLGGVNDFCMTPDINWLGILTNVKGQPSPAGCAKCHTGFGLKPSPQATPEQLQNIDCLICHADASQYKRTVVKNGESFKIAAAPGVDVTALAKKVALPNNGNCLTCHATAGGGPNFKRGDIEPAHKNATRDFDVHAAAGLNCTACHKSKDHKIAGRGTDLRGNDYAEYKVACENCHGVKPHENAQLNKHAVTVYCTVCHIPEYAKESPTDVNRDWGHAELVEKTGLYEPKIKFEKNLKPIYAWYNGKSYAHKTNDPIKLDASGVLNMFKPAGSIDEPGSKIYAFKYHTAKLPYDPQTKLLIPVKTGVMFSKADSKAAIKKGFEDWFKKPYTGHEWVTADRYLGLFHEIAPKEKALKCEDCHSENGVMDFKALGYTGDPQKEGVRQVSAAMAGTHESSNTGTVVIVIVVISVVVVAGFLLFGRNKTN